MVKRIQIRPCRDTRQHCSARRRDGDKSLYHSRFRPTVVHEALALPAVGRRVLEYQTVTTPDNVAISERIIVRDYSMQGVKRSTS
jgi:hypothetical protein